MGKDKTEEKNRKLKKMRQKKKREKKKRMREKKIKGSKEKKVAQPASQLNFTNEN